MGSGSKGTPGEGRPRVVWSPRGRRGWCPGAGRSVSAATTQVPTGWTSYLHWNAVLAALRGRRDGESEASAAEPVVAADPPRPEPRAPLPDRRRRAPSEEPALDGWLDSTPD